LDFSGRCSRHKSGQKGDGSHVISDFKSWFYDGFPCAFAPDGGFSMDFLLATVVIAVKIVNGTLLQVSMDVM
jgi:hypothetical protein